MKLILLAALVAACTATALFPRNITVSNNGSSIQIWTPFRQVSIFRSPVEGSSSIQVSVNGANFPARSFSFSGYPYNGQISVASSEEALRSAQVAEPQYNILQQIFSDFQGAVNDSLYQQLLARVQNAVQQGQVNPQVYQFLSSFESANYGQGFNYLQGYNGPFAQGYGLGNNVQSNGLAYLLSRVYGNQYQGGNNVLSYLLGTNYQTPYNYQSPSVASALLTGQFYQNQYPLNYESQYQGLFGNRANQVYGQGNQGSYGQGYQGVSGQGYQGIYGQANQGVYGQGNQQSYGQGVYGQGYQGVFGQGNQQSYGYQGLYGQGNQGVYGQGYQGIYGNQYQGYPYYQGYQNQIGYQQPIAAY